MPSSTCAHGSARPSMQPFVTQPEDHPIMCDTLKRWAGKNMIEAMDFDRYCRENGYADKPLCLGMAAVNPGWVGGRRTEVDPEKWARFKHAYDRGAKVMEPQFPVKPVYWNTRFDKVNEFDRQERERTLGQAGDRSKSVSKRLKKAFKKLLKKLFK